MTTAKSKARTAKQTYDPDKIYKARVGKAVRYKGTPLRPKHSYRLKGSVLNDLEPDVIVSAEPVINPQ